MAMAKAFGLAFILVSTGVASAQTPAPLFELPAPTGKSAVGTTRWVITDTSREERFAPGKKRDIEVVAWYPSSGASGLSGVSGASGASGASSAPYVRDSMEEVLSFARLAKLGDAFDGLAAVKTHATLDAVPASSPDRLPVILLQHGYTGLPSSHTG